MSETEGESPLWLLNEHLLGAPRTLTWSGVEGLSYKAHIRSGQQENILPCNASDPAVEVAPLCIYQRNHKRTVRLLTYSCPMYAWKILIDGVVRLSLL